MAKKKLHPAVKVAIIVGTVGVTGMLGWVAWSKLIRPNLLPSYTPNPDTPETVNEIIFGNKPTNCRYCDQDATFPLQKGSKGKQVAAAQYGFNQQNPKHKIGVDGHWGNQTEEAIFKSLQAVGVYPSSQSRPQTPIVLSKEVYDKYFKKYENVS